MGAREANDRIAEKAEQLRFISRVPMMCECSASDCRSIVMVWPEEYRVLRQDHENFLTARGHDADRTELVKETAEYDIRRMSRIRRNGDRRLA